jgi:hypothetical protein
MDGTNEVFHAKDLGEGGTDPWRRYYLAAYVLHIRYICLFASLAVHQGARVYRSCGDPSATSVFSA